MGSPCCFISLLCNEVTQTSAVVGVGWGGGITKRPVSDGTLEASRGEPKKFHRGLRSAPHSALCNSKVTMFTF